MTSTTYTVTAQKAVPAPTGSTTGAYGSKPQGGAPSLPAAPPPNDPMAPDAGMLEEPVAHEWAGDPVDPGVDEPSDPATAFASFTGAEGETAWLDRADDGTLTGWVMDADGTVYRYQDTDAWAVDVDDVQMTRAEPGADPAAAGGEIDPETGLPIEGEAEIDPETGLPMEPEGEIDPETGLPLDPEVDDEDLGQDDAFADDGEITPEEDVPEEMPPGLDAEATDQQLDAEDGPEDEFGQPIEEDEDAEEVDPRTGLPLKKKGANPFASKQYVMAVREL